MRDLGGFEVFRFFVVFVKIVQKMLIFVDLLEILLGFGQCECDMHNFSAKCREFVEWLDLPTPKPPPQGRGN